MMRAKTRTMAAVVALWLTGGALASAAPFTFETLPPSGEVSAAPGGTTGWGYIVENPSATDWLEMQAFDSDPFFDGTPTSLFDFPVLAPMESRALPWVLGSAGLLQFTWNASVLPGASNAGEFVLTGVFYSANPIGPEAVATSDPVSQSASYRVSVAPAAAIPEPATMLLVGVGITGVLLRARQARRTRD